jgi:cytochrome c556
MKPNTVIKTFIAGSLVLGLGVTLAYAGADDQIKARQAEMKANGKMMGVLVPMIKGEAPYDAAAVKASIDELAAAEKAANDVKAWDASSKEGATVETWAKPEIWAEGSKFEVKYKAWVDARMALAATTDEASFKAAFPALGDSCKGCHEEFRRPKG